jgi:DnaJ-class molecular chaperone
VLDLDLTTTIATDSALTEFNMNFISRVGDQSQALVRIATKGFLQGQVAPTTNLFVEVDVHTPTGYSERDRGKIKAWIVDAHENEKREYFHLFKQSTIDAWTAP